MSLAQRVRDIRYAKGWGPDELANRAEISRTALYQIESGKTGLPRAGTLRRIAVALEVPMEDLLGFEGQTEQLASHSERPGVGRPRVLHDWVPAEGGPLSLSTVAGVRPVSIATVQASRFSVRGGYSVAEQWTRGDAFPEGADVETARPAPLADRKRRRTHSGRASRNASAVPFFDLIDAFGTRPRFIG